MSTASRPSSLSAAAKQGAFDCSPPHSTAGRHVDRRPRTTYIGDNWRNRYHALVLHNQTHVNHMPYMRFPPTWPAYIPQRQNYAAWFEAYVEGMELNYWTATEFEGGAYNEKRGGDGPSCSAAMTARKERCTRGMSSWPPESAVSPSLPDIPTICNNFGGAVLHSSQYDDGETWRGKRVLVVGSGNSGHDIAQDMHFRAGARGHACSTQFDYDPSMSEPSAQLCTYALYDEGLFAGGLRSYRDVHPAFTGKRKATSSSPKKRGISTRTCSMGSDGWDLKLDFGEDGTGWQFKYLTRGGGYYFNVGCSDLIVKGEIGLAQFSDIASFVVEGARMSNGEMLAADLIVLATGYKGQEYLVRKLFGDDVAVRVGPIWGFGDEQELRNMFTRTAQPGLWFIAGSFAQCRIYSKYLSLQIKACDAGLLPRVCASLDAPSCWSAVSNS